MVLHVFNDNMFIDYGAGPAAVELGRAQSSRFLEDAKAIIKAEGADVQARVYSTNGEPEESVLDFARAEGVDAVICPPKFRSIIKRYKAVLEEQGRGVAESVVLGGDAKGGAFSLGVVKAA